MGATGNILKCDVLVMGGGIAGLLSAIRARDFVDEVILVDKGFVGKNSQSRFSAAQIVVATPGTDIDAWVKDIVESQDYLAHQDIFYEVLRHSYEYMKQLEAWGVEYPKDRKTGDWIWVKSRGTRLVKATRHLGKAFGEFSGGEAVVLAYRKQAVKRKIKIMNRIFLASLITDDEGRVTGAIGFDTRTGEEYTFHAKATILAAGGCSFRGDYAHVWCSTGDAFKLAYDVGAELENMEFNAFNTGSPFLWWEGTGVAIQLGARFLNSKKQQFMNEYHPLGDSADIGFLTRSMALETRLGNGPPFYLTLNEIPDPNNEGYGGGYWGPRHMVSWMPKVIDGMKEFYNYDVFKEPAEWMPVFGHSGGGVRADINCETRVPGLFVAGQAMSTSPDVHTGWSFARYTWSGYRAGESAGKFAKGSKALPLNESQVSNVKRKLLEPLSRTGELSVDDATDELRRILFPFDVLLMKHEERLTKALGELKKLREEQLPKVIAPDTHELVKLKELENMISVAEMTLRASLMRTESRSSHFREDYPYVDNDNWLKWVEISKGGNGEMNLRAESWPLGSNYKLIPPSGKTAIRMPKKAWGALRLKEPCPVSWTPVDENA